MARKGQRQPTTEDHAESAPGDYMEALHQIIKLGTHIRNTCVIFLPLEQNKRLSVSLCVTIIYLFYLTNYVIYSKLRANLVLFIIGKPFPS